MLKSAADTKTPKILEVYENINRVSGIRTFSENFFLHPHLLSLNKEVTSIKNPLEIYKKFKNFDVIYCHQLYSLSALNMILICILLQKKIIMVSHGNLIVREKSRFKKLFFLSITKLMLLFCSSTTQFLNKNEKARSFQITKNNFICPPFIEFNNDLSRENFYMKKDDSKENNLIKFCYLGANYYERKGFDRMLRLCSSFLDSKRKVQLDFIGVSETEFLKKKIKQYGLAEAVNFITPIHGTKKYLKLIEYDAMLLLSRSEGWPMVVLEAINVKLPLVVSRGTNISDLIETYELGLVLDYFDDCNLTNELHSLSYKKDEFIKKHNNDPGYLLARNELLCL